MTELRAQMEGVDVTVHIEDPDSLSTELKDALANLADAMAQERLGEDEVQGFGLNLGGLGLSGVGMSSTKALDCWGYSEGDSPAESSCTWMSSSGETIYPGDCTMYTKK